MADSNYELKIANVHDVVMGHFVDVPITIEAVGTIDGDPVDLGGFDLLLAYHNNTTISFVEAVPGSFMEDCEWEYFTYRFLGQEYNNCSGGNDPTVTLIRLVALADIVNPEVPACFRPQPEDLPVELVRVKFYASTTTSNPRFTPINFYWLDCGDNSFSPLSGEPLLLADHVYDTASSPLTPGPLCGGPDASCYGEGAIKKVDFYNGGVTRICTDPDCILGDINLNGIAYELADAQLFQNFFISSCGICVFDINEALQIQATDINCDGKTLSIADLVFLVRIIAGDAVPCTLE
jgi:hypothetical protein